MSMHILIVGAGGVGSAAARIASRRTFFDALTIADYDPARPQAVVDAVGDRRYSAAQIDASSREAIVALIRSTGATHVLNAVDPRFVMPIFEACREAGAVYLDMAMSLSRPHPERPYELTGVKLGDEQWGQDEQWQAEGRLALVGIGVEPRLSNVFARYAADELFDEIDLLSTRDGANLTVEGHDFAPSFSIWTTLEECLNPPVVWDGEQREWHTAEPFSEPVVFEFPEGIGEVECVNVEHEEVLMMPRWIDAKRVDFKYGLGDEFIEVLKTLDKLGLASTEPIDVKGQKVSPRDVVAAALPDPATLGPLMKGKTCAGLYVEGRRKDGKEGGLYLYHVADNEETMARDGSQAVTWPTAVNPVIALELLATSVWEGTGVRGPETFAPRPFLDLLARLEALVDEDVTAMASSPEGPAVYYLTSSFAAQSPLERTVVAATRLAQAGSAEAARALRDARDRWYGLIREEVLDPVVAKFVLLAGDGVSHQTDIRGEGDDEEFVSAEDIAALGALLARLRRS